VTRAKRKNPNRAGTDARKRKDGRYETRATLNTPMGRRRVSFDGDTVEEANNKKFWPTRLRGYYSLTRGG
jgi:hypothetical protein